ncbi:LytR/AlgR family response regulator transcription factor [Membranihabitans maritimus]|uniref:LytR/AlgR family response regulator transcription factor n=1 Tax=Membranihabitans maritimus TaxID=2904244 RepID=UPI001F37EB45|nr:response regulator transcription factor [Membranihabitans maritimus]
MKCIIIEDQPPAQRILKKFIEDYGSLELQAIFSEALSALDYLKKEKVELIFLDIHLPKISGIDFLKTLVHPPKIILTTAFPDYALESYEFDVVDYLLKPFSFQRFVKAVTRARNIPVQGTNPDSGEEQENELFVKSGYEYIKVSISDILYIRTDADYTEIYIPVRKILSSESLRYWVENLPDEKFIQVHRSFVVQISKIEKFAGNRIELVNGDEIPIGRAYKEAFVQRLV